MGFPSKTNDNDSDTSVFGCGATAIVFGCGATAIWNSNVVGAVISTSSSVPTSRFIAPMMRRSFRFRELCDGAESVKLPRHGGLPEAIVSGDFPAQFLRDLVLVYRFGSSPNSPAPGREDDTKSWQGAVESASECSSKWPARWSRSLTWRLSSVMVPARRG